MERIKLDDFAAFKFLSGIEYNRAGTKACYVVHQAQMEENAYNSTLWVYDREQDMHFQLTGLGEERSFIWLEDGEHVLFAANRDSKEKDAHKDGKEQTVFYKININGGEARKAFTIPLKVSTIEQITTDCFLLLATTKVGQPPLYTLTDENRKLKEERHKEDKDYEVLEEIPYWWNGKGFASKQRTRAFLYTPSSGAIQPITDENLQIDAATINASRTHALLIASPIEGKMELTNSLYIADLENLSVRKVPDHGEFSFSYAHFISDEQVICCGKSFANYGLNENPGFFIIDIESGYRQDLAPDWDLSTWNSVGSDCRYGGGKTMRYIDGYLYFVATERFDSQIYKIDLEGNIERLTNGSGSVDAFAVHKDIITWIGLRDLKLQEVYSWHDGEEKKLTEFNDWVAKERTVAQPLPLSVSTAPGVTIDGWVLKPIDWEEGERYPAILNIHGGPKTVYGEVFYHEMQYWANQGYFVMFCNPRGSDGKGNAFADIRGKYGTIDYDDIMLFTDEVLRNYQEIDPERLGVTGGSYGGFMTNWIIGHTQRFKVAASQRSISNWVSMGWTTDIGYYFAPDQIGATPWSDYAKLWQHSPLKYADQVRTPTLFIHSEQDYRCWLPEGLQMFSALKFHNVESKLVMFREENHELSRSGKPKHRARRLTEITQWFDKYLQTT